LKISCALQLLFYAASLGWSSSLIIGGPGDGGNTDPFGGPFGLNPGTRYQQIYASGDFNNLGIIEITSIDFFDGNGAFAGDTYIFSFSTVSAGIDTLSDTAFNANLGPDDALFATVNLSGAAPSTLTIVGSAFLYNPALGNLLLDMTILPGGTSGDAAYLARNGTAEGIFSRYDNFGGSADGYGLVTQVDYLPASSPTPEPETATLVLAGLGCITLYCRFRYRR